MARRMTISGTEELSRLLNDLSNAAEFVAPMMLYKGAGVVADAVTESINGIVAEEFHYLAAPELTGTKRYASLEEKALLQNGAAGIAKFDKNGSEVTTSVGFNNSGYGEIKGRTVPIPMIANAINSGTSFMHKQPFFQKAVTRARANAQQAMIAEGEAQLDKLTK